MQIIEFFPQGFSANCYALVEGEDIALIDVGTATTEIIDFVKKNSNNVKYILLTHDHFDHIGGVEEVLKHCSAKVCIHKNDVSGLIDSTFSLCDMAGVRNQLPRRQPPRGTTEEKGDEREAAEAAEAGGLAS